MIDYKLREWQLSDAKALVQHLNYPEVTTYFRNSFPQPYTFSDARVYITTNQYDQEKLRRFCRCIEVDNQAVGSIDIMLQNDVQCKSAELGYFLARKWWGHGIMPRAIQQACQHVFQHFDVVRIYAEVFQHNRASCRALEKAGFVKEATLQKSIFKNGLLMDSNIYALLREI